MNDLSVHNPETNLSQLRSYDVVKSNTLIQKARFNLNLQEHKIILRMIQLIKPGETEFQIQTFSIKEFCELCGIDETNGKNYINIKRALKSLDDRSYWFPSVSPAKKPSEKLFRWLDYCEIEVGKGNVYLRLNNSMKPYLLELKGYFTQYSLYYVLGMKSQYSIRIYELLKSYQKKGTCAFYIEELKQLLLAEQYTQWNDFKRRVIDTSVKEINKMSDIQVSYELEKEGKKFTIIKFIINLKTDMKDKLETWENIDKALYPKKKKGQMSITSIELMDQD